MLRPLMLLLTAAAIAFLGGGLSVHYALRRFGGFDRLQIGQWSAYPQAGTEEAEPYARAKAERQEEISLGRAEGLSLYLSRDDSGEALSGSCRYILHGQVPEARFFTLYATDKAHIPAAAPAGLPGALFSQDIIRDESGAINVLLSPRAQAGNWLAVPQGAYSLQLNLYDTPITAMTGTSKPVMPALTRIREGRCG